MLFTVWGPAANLTGVASGNSAACNTDEAKESGVYWNYDPVDAYEFGIKIQSYVEKADLLSLFSLVEGELKNGPRKSFIQGKSFSEVFSRKWRERVLSEKPPCTPYGWRGFNLGLGVIWYHYSDRWTIFSINGALIEAAKEPLDVSWKYKDTILPHNCFTLMWFSSDNYEEFYKSLEKKDADFLTFYANIGRYIGGQIPLGPIVASWEEEISLTPKLSQCVRHDKLSKVEITDSWVVTRNYTANDCSSERCLDAGYRVLKRISLDHCRLLVPYFAETCLDMRLVQIFQETGGSMGNKGDVGIYGIIKDPASKELHIAPLANFDSVNDALNYVDQIDQ